MKVDCSLTCDCTFASGCKFEAEQAAARAAKTDAPQNLKYTRIIVRKRTAGPLRQIARDLRNDRIERGEKYYRNKEKTR